MTPGRRPELVRLDQGRARAVGLVLLFLLLVACTANRPMDTAFAELEDALLPSLRQVTKDRSENVASARYEAIGEPAEITALLRSSLVEHGFMLYDGSGLLNPSITQPQPREGSGPNPTDLGPPPTMDASPVDAIQIKGVRGHQDLGIRRVVYLSPASRRGWTAVEVRVERQD